jgi:hypothetical protein
MEMDTQSKGRWRRIHRARAVADGYTELGQMEMDTQIKGCCRWIHRARTDGDGYTELGSWRIIH